MHSDITYGIKINYEVFIMKKPMLIKICGITNQGDAKLAVESGATALGFIFAPSKRQVTPAQAKKITARLPCRIEKIGVFINEQQEKILQIAEMAGLSCIQLHGNESQAMCDELSKYFKIIKTVKIDPWGKIISKNDYCTWKILLDTYVPQLEGGSGKRFKWEILRQFDLDDIIVAGGLNHENIGLLLSQYQPFGIDVCSGVEAWPGKKDTEKLNRFFKQISYLNLE
jgi:phosphoribosylanthranilate isomerase